MPSTMHQGVPPVIENLKKKDDICKSFLYVMGASGDKLVLGLKCVLDNIKSSSSVIAVVHSSGNE
ncbi:hypothetical protein CDL15_Pgr012267 [Punica granatum]|uniref:Uncharacterized protein n=1 Tax=Punica granatum TaxID=22663 RepID=A0A218WR21_PUNGR|nr:hypothetical protein CDL15_Pgr012267 [Punica granatum]